MVSFTAHDCSSIVISTHMPNNANMVTLRVAGSLTYSPRLPDSRCGPATF